MSAPFGPWTTALGAGLGLGTFWRQRLRRLPALGGPRSRSARGPGLLLMLLGLSAFLLPTWRARAVPQASAPQPDAPAAPVGPGDEDDKALELFREVYALGDGEVMKRVAPLYPPGRRVYFRRRFPNRDALDPDGPPNTIFSWRGKDLDGSPSGWSNGRVQGAHFLWQMVGVFPQDIEGDLNVLKAPIRGDFVIRDDAPPEQRAARLEEILRRECGLPVKLTFREVERPVLVARGKYRYTPHPNATQGTGIEIFGKAFGYQGGGQGSFAEFLGWVGMYTTRPVINEVEEAPRGKLVWMVHRVFNFHQKENLDEAERKLALEHLTEQTRLTFVEDKRRVRTLFVERKD
jgi:hypothetical protein